LKITETVCNFFWKLEKDTHQRSLLEKASKPWWLKNRRSLALRQWGPCNQQQHPYVDIFGEEHQAFQQHQVSLIKHKPLITNLSFTEHPFIVLYHIPLSHSPSHHQDMEASAGLVAGSHNRNELVVIHGHEEVM